MMSVLHCSIIQSFGFAILQQSMLVMLLQDDHS